MGVDQVSSSRGAAVRLECLDRIRGLAIVCMVVDHLALVLGTAGELRLTVGRVAVPLFFLLAGHLARAPRARHAAFFALGVVLPVLVPWLDAPNVLVWWALGVVVLHVCRWGGVPVWVVVAVCLTVLVNGWGAVEGSYSPYGLWALMGVGSMLTLPSFWWGNRLPSFLAVLGRWPVTIYAGHVLLLALAVEVFA